MVNIIKDEDAIWHTDEYEVILVGTSTYCMLTNGFQSKLRLKYPYIEKPNNETNYGDKRKLGKRLTIDGKPIISLLYISGYPSCKRVTLDYEALENCLATANKEFKGKRVMTTMIGCSIFDGNGDKNKVMDIINRTCTDIILDIYDYKQLRKRDECDNIIRKKKKKKNINKEKYKELLQNKDEIFKELYLEY